MKLIALSFIAALTLFAAGSHSNRRAPGFSLMDHNFDQHDLNDYLGKVVVVDFMQTTCPVCNSVADVLKQLTERYGDKIQVLSMVTQPDNFDTAAKFAADHKAKWPILFDSGQVMMSYLQLKPTGSMDVHFPVIFLIDPYGAIRNDISAQEPDMLTVGGLSKEIDKMLAKK